MKANARSAAARAVASVMGGRSLDDALTRADRGLTPGDKSLSRALSYGVLRDHGLLSDIVNQMLKAPMPGEPEVLALIEVGLFQLRSMRVSAHAAVSETVSACELIEKPKFRGLINALLRRYQRESEALEATAMSRQTALFSCPPWLIEQVRRDWPDCWESILTAGNQQGPMTLRVNARKSSPTDYLHKLSLAGIKGALIPGVQDAILLESAVPVARLPAFDQGEVSVQDASAQLAVDLLELESGHRVLDACAAPGGKTCHMLERADVQVLAIDREAPRLPRLTESLRRLSVKAETRACEAQRLADRWNGAKFDRILIDAPCSGTGVIRRHPDIKWLRRETDIAQLASEQSEILTSLWPLLATGGKLVYATCSIFSEEGDNVIQSFLRSEPGARLEKLDAEWGQSSRFGRRIAPGGAFDGFYYACLRKPAARKRAAQSVK